MTAATTSLRLIDALVRLHLTAHWKREWVSDFDTEARFPKGDGFLSGGTPHGVFRGEVSAVERETANTQSSLWPE